MTVSEDKQIIADCLDGNRESYALLINKYQAIITSQMRGYARDDSALEELVQDVFVTAYLSLKGFRGEAPFEHWLRKIASRVGYRYLKQLSKEPVKLPVEEWDAVTHPPEEMEADEALALLKGLLARLCPEDQAVLTMMYLEELSTKEIAARMGWNRAMVKMRAYRARNKLKAIVDEENLDVSVPG